MTRPGFTLLEAAVAMMIISIVSVAALGAFGADLRAADRARQMLPAAALAQDRLAVIEGLGPALSLGLPDSLAHGRFTDPFDAYVWIAAVNGVRSTPGLVELRTEIRWAGGAFAITQRRYLPSPDLARRFP
jgi:prepilin-type N-terminal cleavage/methylation domain-containing protein